MDITKINFDDVDRILFYGQSFSNAEENLLASVPIKNFKHEETALLAYNDSLHPGPETYLADRVEIVDADDKKYTVLKILKPSVSKRITFLMSDGKPAGEIDFSVNVLDSAQYSDSVIMVSYGAFDAVTDPTTFLHEHARNAHWVDIKVVPFEVSKGTGVHPMYMRNAIVPTNSQVVGQNFVHRNFKITYLGNTINDKFNVSS